MTLTRVFAITLLAGSVACSSRQAVPLDFVSTAEPNSIQVFDGYKVFEVTGPKVNGDSMRGVVNGANVAIPVRKVQGITTVKFSSARTALLVGSLAGIGVFMGYVMSTDPGSEMVQCEYDNPAFLSDLCRINR